MRLFFVTFQFISVCPWYCIVLFCDGPIPTFKELSQICKIVTVNMIAECLRTDCNSLGDKKNIYIYIRKHSVALVRKRTIPTEQPPPVGEVSANFCG